MNLWLLLEQARNANAAEIQKIEKMIEKQTTINELPEFFRPQAMLKVFRYDALEETMKKYQMHFQKEIDTNEMKLDLSGWKILLEYCIKNNKPLERISNIDIYRIKHSSDLSLEEHEIHHVPVSYQRCKIYRKILRAKNICKIQSSISVKKANGGNDSGRRDGE